MRSLTRALHTCVQNRSSRTTIVAGVPTLWLLLTDWLEQNGKRFSSLQALLSAGAAMPRELVAKLHDRYGLTTVHSWGMTEAPGATSGMFRSPAKQVPEEELLHRRTSSGSANGGIKLGLVDEQGQTISHDGKTPGHLRVKGPWVASAYFKGDGHALGNEGWLQTGDIATIDAEGCPRLVDRAKDVIKSGGEWISSVAVENATMSHPGVLQAAVIGIAHPIWQERPLLVVVRREGGAVTASELLDHIRPALARFWLPDAVEFVGTLPTTGTGKVSKTVLRHEFRDYRLPVADKPAPMADAARVKAAE
jgi:acyl-CoA synthetase (AMP-forming)/AMP-acid ligase II